MCLSLSNKIFVWRFDNILNIWLKGALQKSREVQKITPEMSEADQRMSVISYSTLAEMNHFKNEIKIDYNEMIKEFLKSQIQFYENVRESFCNSNFVISVKGVFTSFFGFQWLTRGFFFLFFQIVLKLKESLQKYE